jgi:hypothetical protein
MRKTLLQLLGGLLAVAALAAIPAAATGDATTTRAGDPGGCNDSVPPYSRWGHGWSDHDNNGRYWRGWGDGNGYFGGRAWDPNCDAAHKGRVARVMVAVDRMRGDQCQRLSSKDRLGKRVDCSQRRWLRARGTTHWRHHIGRSLPRGHYRLHRRAIDAAGNKERPHTRHIWIR